MIVHVGGDERIGTGGDRCAEHIAAGTAAYRHGADLSGRETGVTQAGCVELLLHVPEECRWRHRVRRAFRAHPCLSPDAPLSSG